MKYEQCYTCGELEYVCSVCGRAMPSKRGKFVLHTRGGGEFICAGSFNVSGPELNEPRAAPLESKANP